MITRNQVIEVAKQCFDPEIPVNIWDLGLVYDIQIDPAGEVIQIKLTLTSQNCPSAKEIPTQLKNKIQTTLNPKQVDVEVVFEPLWTPERMTEDAKKKLGIEA